jgi:vancomycin permeability regulator SanA
VNRCLKVIQAVCGIDFTLTFHIARHTFAKTIALKSGIPLETVQIMMGHSKITTTQIYADVDEERVLDDTAGWKEKLDKKKNILLSTDRQDNSHKFESPVEQPLNSLTTDLLNNRQ